MTVINRVCVILAILADALVLAITWQLLPPTRTFRHRVKLLGGKGLMYVVLRNGSSMIQVSLRSSEILSLNNFCRSYLLNVGAAYHALDRRGHRDLRKSLTA